jgi:hypothetical protein
LTLKLWCRDRESNPQVRRRSPKFAPPAVKLSQAQLRPRLDVPALIELAPDDDLRKA